MAVFTDISGGNNIPRLQQVELTNPIQSNVPIGLDLSAMNNAINTIAGAQDRQLRKQELAFDQKVQERAFAQQNYQISKDLVQRNAGNIAGSTGDGSNVATSLGALTEYKTGLNLVTAVNQLTQDGLNSTNEDGTYDMQKLNSVLKREAEFYLNEQTVMISGTHKMVRKWNDNIAKFQGKDTGVIDVNKYAEINSKIGDILNKERLDYNDVEAIKALTSENVFIKDPDGKFEKAITNFETKLKSTYDVKSYDDGVNTYTVNTPTLSSEEIVKQFTSYWTSSPTNKSIAEHYGWLVNGKPTKQMTEYANTTATNYLQNAAAGNFQKSIIAQNNLLEAKGVQDRLTEQYKATLKGEGTGSQAGFTRLPGMNYEINSGTYNVLNEKGLIPSLSTAQQAMQEQLDIIGKPVEKLTVGEYEMLLNKVTEDVDDIDMIPAMKSAIRSMRPITSRSTNAGAGLTPEAAAAVRTTSTISTEGINGDIISEFESSSGTNVINRDDNGQISAGPQQLRGKMFDTFAENFFKNKGVANPFKDISAVDLTNADKITEIYDNVKAEYDDFESSQFGFVKDNVYTPFIKKSGEISNVSMHSGARTAAAYVSGRLSTKLRNELIEEIEAQYDDKTGRGRTNNQLSRNNPDDYLIAMEGAIENMVSEGKLETEVLDTYRKVTDRISSEGGLYNLDYQFKLNQSDNNIVDASEFAVAALKNMQTNLPIQSNVNVDPSKLVITSIKRSAAENAAAGGHAGSHHLTGSGVDISTSNRDGKNLAKFVDSEEGKAYFDSINVRAINEGDHIHIEPSKGTVVSNSNGTTQPTPGRTQFYKNQDQGLQSNQNIDQQVPQSEISRVENLQEQSKEKFSAAITDVESLPDFDEYGNSKSKEKKIAIARLKQEESNTNEKLDRLKKAATDKANKIEKISPIVDEISYTTNGNGIKLSKIDTKGEGSLYVRKAKDSDSYILQLRRIGVGPTTYPEMTKQELIEFLTRYRIRE